MCNVIDARKKENGYWKSLAMLWQKYKRNVSINRLLSGRFPLIQGQFYIQNTFSQLFQTKRQLYREHLLPQKGGKIPDSAFQVDRLAANRLNKEGISIPDGVLLEQRHHESHFGSHRFDPDIERSIIRIKQTPDGRFTPVEGRYPVFENEIYSTYIIRPPYHNYNLVLPPFAPNFASQSIEIPTKLTHSKELSPKNTNQNFHRNRLDHNSLLYNKPQPDQSSGYYYPKPEPPKNTLVRSIP